MRSRLLVSLSAIALALSGCSSAEDLSPSVHSEGVLTSAKAATVIDQGEGSVLCLGVVGESFIPTCEGPPISGWDWEAVEQDQTSGGTRWGLYDVVGTWDGSLFTVAGEPVPSAPASEDANGLDEANVAAHSSEVVATALVDYAAKLDESGGVLSVMELDGQARVLVVFDDGTMQADADDRYGSDVVVIESRLDRVDQS